MQNTIDPGTLQRHCAQVARALLRGRVVPFLGAGVNLCDRPKDAVWKFPGAEFLPSGGELAQYLAREFDYPIRQSCHVDRCSKPHSLDLARVSQYGVTMLGDGPLYDPLRGLFAKKFLPSTVHSFLAGLPAATPEHARDRHLLIVTTNYDDMMEQALGYDSTDLVFYNPSYKDPSDKGSGYAGRPRFLHRPPKGVAEPIEGPQECPYPFCEHRPVVLKIHGTIDNSPEQTNRVVITEDDYIEYLTQAPLDGLLPSSLIGRMRSKHHLLFLGYSLQDWNLRVFLRRLKREASETYIAWAVLLNADEAETRFWQKNDVHIIPVDLKTYIDVLSREVVSRTATQQADSTPEKADG